jgi:ubiquinone/menaquinone biosynthesis C-methylase UbiE
MSRLISALKLFSFLLVPRLGRVRALYEVLDENNSLCRNREYLNLGFWADGAADLDAAAEAMANRMAGAADLDSTSEVLDAGCGFGDQDLFWADRFQPKRITAINLSSRQLVRAQGKSRSAKLSRGIAFVEADACTSPFKDGSFDIVFALESAFHFRTRDRFFGEAIRVLRAKGRLVMMDLAGVDRRLELKDRLVERIGRSFWQIPKENLYPASVYAERLRRAGFTEVSVDSVWHSVYPPFVRWARSRLQEADIRKRLNPTFRLVLQVSLKARTKLDPEAMDYVFVRAAKPAERRA